MIERKLGVVGKALDGQTAQRMGAQMVLDEDDIDAIEQLLPRAPTDDDDDEDDEDDNHVGRQQRRVPRSRPSAPRVTHHDDDNNDDDDDDNDDERRHYNNNDDDDDGDMLIDDDERPAAEDESREYDSIQQHVDLSDSTTLTDDPILSDSLGSFSDSFAPVLSRPTRTRTFESSFDAIEPSPSPYHPHSPPLDRVTTTSTTSKASAGATLLGGDGEHHDDDDDEIVDVFTARPPAAARTRIPPPKFAAPSSSSSSSATASTTPSRRAATTHPVRTTETPPSKPAKNTILAYFARAPKVQPVLSVDPIAPAPTNRPPARISLLLDDDNGGESEEV